MICDTFEHATKEETVGVLTILAVLSELCGTMIAHASVEGAKN
jgi:hypothetical protein